eukprot:CAMPEP_0113496322 /NCGR_PEP_ID=MMETSP0014_2-20120614/30062_1 /TAXON_ID=2857 /ORGANISM="Nitzschia sp." /LENGTH=678 /DNA_ID=CAMNT_0000390241 /DNA_START=42 /DNA_END=2078 /DNA_ORIENTATION=- /assembly_acc=CAM_ASM_000159
MVFSRSLTATATATAVVAVSVLSCSIYAVGAFVNNVDTSSTMKSPPTTQTSLNAVPPPFIIGPMLKRMREEKEKKKMPMVVGDEGRGQAPGLRVGGSAWKWPPIWPYDQDFFTPNEDIETPANTAQGQLQPMMGLMAGMPQQQDLTDPAAIADAAGATTAPPEDNKLDPLTYWSVEKADVRTELDSEAIEQLKKHYAFYLKDGMSVLEFGAAEDSYLPDNLKIERHIGVGLNEKLMKENPSLTDRLVVDLNKVVEDEDVDSNELRQLGSEPFDAIIMANTADFLTHPREVYKTAWRLLKPGGIMIVAFTSKTAYTDKFERAQTMMWRNYNDDQHMWAFGSFFQFSAGEGWENLLGFDISPESAKDAFEDSGPFNLFQKGKDNNMYVVQATKAEQDEEIDEEDPAKSINSRMWMLPTMEDRDKKLVVPRLGRAYKVMKTNEQKDTIVDNLSLLPKIYEALIKMDQFAFTFQMQSQLAADLVLDEDFTASDEQILALKQGLGLRTPSPEFWQPVGELTGDIDIYDKINLLAHLVPRFGSGDADQEEALLAFATGLKPTFDLIRSKSPDMSESDVQLLGTELLCAEILIPGRSTKAEFAGWLNAMTEAEMKETLASRKMPNEKSNQELTEYKKEMAEKDRKRAELRKRYEEQMAKAKAERSVQFDVATGKFVIIDDKDKKK